MKTKLYAARAEYRIHKPDIEKKLEDGHRVSHIYNDLFQAGKITMSYSTFCSYVRGQGEKASKRKNLQKPIMNHRPQPASPSNSSSGFHHEKVANLEELVGPGAGKKK